MKLSAILEILATARLPSVTGDQLRQLVGTAEGKAFADDLKWFAAGETGRREQLAAVVHALAPAVRGTVEQLGFRFDLAALIAAGKREGDQVFAALKASGSTAADRRQAAAFLRGIGMQALPSAAPAAAPVPPAGPVEPPYYSFKVFGRTAALCISEARTRTGNQHTIQIEGALLLAGDGRKEFDWRNKIIVQLTVQEAYLALAFFENLIPSVKFDGHGRAHDKSLHLEFQETHYFAKLIQRGRAAVALPVRAVDAIQIVALLYKQLLRNEAHLRIEDIRGMVGRVAAMTGAGAALQPQK
jgi:hypothetical protein